MPSSPFLTQLVVSWPPAQWQEVTVVVAVSGGPDSIALLRGLADLKRGGCGQLVVGHFNHHLRGEESMADEQFVRRICCELGLSCEVGEANPPADSAEPFSEDDARRVRYTFLKQMAATVGARYVVTAHTADDQAETVLHRIVRGTGVRGLRGMARARPLGHATLLRPLLRLRRAVLLEYLDSIGQAFRTDSSNNSLLFTRNRIRQELLPQLATRYNRGIVEALLRLGELAADAHAMIDPQTDALFERAVEGDLSGPVRIDLAALSGQPRYLVRELFAAIWTRQGWPMQPMGYDDWQRLAEMVTASPASSRPSPGSAESTKQVLPGGVRVERGEAEIILQRK